MITEVDVAEAVMKLRQALAQMKQTEIWAQIVTPRDDVFARFQPIFNRTHLPQLTMDEFRPFFYFENNCHWTGLHRQVNRICADLPKLRTALLTLTDETRPVQVRFDAVITMHGMGKGILTGILTIAFPAKCVE